MHQTSSGIEHRRTLGVFTLAMLSIAVVVSLRNLPITAQFGLSSLFYYVLAAILFMIPYALVSAELASGWPKAGGIYIWVREALGDRWGWFAMWMQWVHNITWYPAMLSFVGAGIAYVFKPELAESKGFLLAVILIGMWGITFINFLGVKASARVSTTFVILGTIIPGAILIVLAIAWIFMGKPIHFAIGVRELFPNFTNFDNLVFLGGIFLALSGLEANANLAREVKNPQRSFPRAIFLAAIMTIGLLALGSLAVAAVVPKENISLVAGLLEAFNSFFNAFNMPWLIPIIAVFTIIGAVGELNAWAIAGAKGIFVTTEHGVIPPYFHKVNKKHVPTRVLVFQAILVTISSLIFLYLPNVNVSYWMLSALAAQNYIIMYLFLFLAGIVLRYKKPHVHRTYQVPGGKAGMWIVCVVGFIASLFGLFVTFLPPSSFPIGNVFVYEAILISGCLFFIVVPLIIYALKKPHWKRVVLPEIREQIRSSIRR